LFPCRHVGSNPTPGASNSAHAKEAVDRKIETLYKSGKGKNTEIKSNLKGLVVTLRLLYTATKSISVRVIF